MKPELGEIDKENYSITDKDNDKKYRSGVYQCKCGKLFHGHGNRDFHSFTRCPKKEPTK
jgi:hypothetical protein